MVYEACLSCWVCFCIISVCDKYDFVDVPNVGPYSSVVEHSLRKRKVGGSIPPGGSSFASPALHAPFFCSSSLMDKSTNRCLPSRPVNVAHRLHYLSALSHQVLYWVRVWCSPLHNLLAGTKLYKPISTHLVHPLSAFSLFSVLVSPLLFCKISPLLYCYRLLDVSFHQLASPLLSDLEYLHTHSSTWSWFHSCPLPCFPARLSLRYVFCNDAFVFKPCTTSIPVLQCFWTSVASTSMCAVRAHQLQWCELRRSLLHRLHLHRILSY